MNSISLEVPSKDTCGKFLIILKNSYTIWMNFISEVTILYSQSVVESASFG